MEPDLIFALFMKIWTTAGLQRKLFKMCKKKPAWKMQRMKAKVLVHVQSCHVCSRRRYFLIRG